MWQQQRRSAVRAHSAPTLPACAADSLDFWNRGRELTSGYVTPFLSGYVAGRTLDCTDVAPPGAPTALPRGIACSCRGAGCCAVHAEMLTTALPSCHSAADGSSCQQQADWGKCSSDWMLQGGFCDATCGRCGSQQATPSGSDGSSQLPAAASVDFDASFAELNELARQAAALIAQGQQQQTGSGGV